MKRSPCPSPLRRALAVAAGASALVAGVARADGAAALAELDAAGRAIAAEKCSRPVEVKTSFVRNPVDRAVADEMQSTDCRSFSVAVYRALAPAPLRELPMSVVLRGAHPRIALAWSVGAQAAAVRAALGAPQRQFGENLVYGLRSGAQDSLTFEVKAGIVDALSWNWDVD